jgi:excisionase family DNA binding protein
MANLVPRETADSIALSIEKACELCSLGRTKFYELLKSKTIPARKVGRRTIVLRSELEKALESLPVAGRAAL